MGYRMDFYGTTICYSIFANTWYGDSPWSGDNICGANGQSFGLFPFDQNIDLIENGLTIGDAWDGRSRHCEGGNRTDNIWVGDGGGHRDYDGYVKVEVRRRPSSGSGGLYVGASCTVGGAILDGIDTPVDAIFSEIKVGYDDSDDQAVAAYSLPADVTAETWTIALSGKDLLIVALCAVTVLLVTFICVSSRMTGAQRKYRVVSMAGDSEMEEFQK